MEALEYFKRMEKKKERFTWIIETLKENDVQIRVYTMAFVNAILSNPEDVMLRINTRLEMIHLGIRDVMRVRSISLDGSDD